MKTLFDLTPKETKLRAALSSITNKGYWAAAIRITCEVDDANVFRQLVQELKSQAEDNPNTMLDIIGRKAFLILKGL